MSEAPAKQPDSESAQQQHLRELEQLISGYDRNSPLHRQMLARILAPQGNGVCESNT